MDKLEKNRVNGKNEEEDDLHCDLIPKKIKVGKIVFCIDGFKGKDNDELKRWLLENTMIIVNRKRSDGEEGFETIK